MKISNFLILVLFIITACIEPITFENPGNKTPVVISGYITDQTGGHRVSVGYSVPYTSSSFRAYAFTPIQDAQVLIIDDDGNETQLHEDLRAAGNYLTDDEFKGEIGRKYKVQVQIEDGQAYESSWEELKPVTAINDLSITPYEQRSIENGIEVVEKGIDAFVTFDDPADIDNYYRWRWFGTYEVQFSLDDKGPCWITEPDIDLINILEDGFQDGMTIERTAASVKIKNRTNAQNKYILTVQQLSLTRRAYEFYELLNKQREQQGTIFDETPAPVRGNLNAVNDPDELVLGYFHASSIKTSRISIETIIDNAGEILDCDLFVQMGFRPPTLCYNCEQLRFSSRIKPDWY